MRLQHIIVSGLGLAATTVAQIIPNKVSLGFVVAAVSRPIAAYGLAVRPAAISFDALMVEERAVELDDGKLHKARQNGNPFSNGNNPFSGGNNGNGGDNGSGSGSGSGGQGSGNGNGSNIGNGNGFGNGNKGPNGGFGRQQGGLFFPELQKCAQTHGIIMSLVVVVLFPVGAMVMRIFGKWWLHAGIQGMAMILLVVGFGLGVFLARFTKIIFRDAHTIFGTFIVIFFLVAMPIMGWFQHSYFRKNKRRGPWGYAHLWLGRVLILFGVINGGIGINAVEGLEFPGAPSYIKLYIAISVVMGVLYAITILVTAILKRRKVAEEEKIEPPIALQPRPEHPPQYS